MKTTALYAMFLAIGIGIAAAEDGLFTNVYVVPATFLKQSTASNGPSLPNAKEILEAAGITFAEGSSAIYNPTTSQLFVRNTEDQIELVEAYIDSLRQQVEKQVYIKVREAIFDPDQVPPSLEGIATDPIGGAGDIQLPSQAESVDPIKDLENQMSRPPNIDAAPKLPVRKGIVGVFTDPQLQHLLKEIGESPKVDLLTAASIVCRSGEPGLIQVQEKRWGFIPVLGANEYTLDLTLYLPSHGKALPEGRPSVRVTIWDGQTVAYAEDQEDGTRRVAFITAQLIDAAGIPIQKPNPAQLTQSEQENVRLADEAALSGSNALSEKDFENAERHYLKALELLPEHEITRPRREAYEKQFVRIRKQRLENRNEAGITSITTHIVRDGETLFGIARRYDLSVTKLEAANRLSSNTLRVGQLLVIPERPADSRLGDVLKSLVIPEFECREMPLHQALGIIQNEILQATEGGLFPDLQCEMLLEIPKETSETQITLRLTNVPAREALRYTTALARCHYKLVGNTIVIIPEETAL